MNLSDPPYYTTCPSPFIADFIKHWRREQKTQCVQRWLARKPVGQAFQPAINYPEPRRFTKQDLDIVHQYKRRLPHWELEGSTYFVIFRVEKSVAQPFRAAELASIVEEAIWYHYGDRYALDAYVIMPDHVRLLLRPLSGWSLARILQGVKGLTARKINKLFNRKRSFLAG